MFSIFIKIRNVVITVISIIVVFSIAILVLCSVKQKKETVPENYLKSFGYEIELIEEKKIIIPKNFSAGLLEYNNLQKQQGFDLSKYSGKECIQRQYSVKSENISNDEYVASVIVYDEKLIGGDIHNKTYGSKAMKFDSLK